MKCELVAMRIYGGLFCGSILNALGLHLTLLDELLVTDESVVRNMQCVRIIPCRNLAKPYSPHPRVLICVFDPRPCLAAP